MVPEVELVAVNVFSVGTVATVTSSLGAPPVCTSKYNFCPTLRL